MVRMGRLVPVALLIAVVGCYDMKPAMGVEPEIGSRIAFDVNDVGRSALSGTMGGDIAQVDGRLLEKENGSYLLSVLSVRLRQGGEQVWSGEQVRLQSDYLGARYERRFSAGRSVALAAAGIGGIGAFLATRSLLGAGQEEPPPGCENPPCNPDTRLGRLVRP